MQFGVLVDLLARLVMPLHESGQDERLRLTAALREATFEKERVQSLLHAAPAPSSR